MGCHHGITRLDQLSPFTRVMAETPGYLNRNHTRFVTFRLSFYHVMSLPPPRHCSLLPHVTSLLFCIITASFNIRQHCLTVSEGADMGARTTVRATRHLVDADKLPLATLWYDWARAMSALMASGERTNGRWQAHQRP